MRRAPPSSAPPAATTRLTSPKRRASSAPTISPRSSISIACLRDRLRDNATIGVEQNRPICTPGVQNSRFRAGDREVAARHELAAGRRRDALDRGDDRLRQAHDRLHHRRAAGQDIGEIGPAPVRIRRVGGHFLQVVPGREDRPFRRRAPRPGSCCRPRWRRVRAVQRRDQRLGQGVARVRAVEDKRHDRVRVRAQERAPRSAASAFIAASWMGIGWIQPIVGRHRRGARAPDQRFSTRSKVSRRCSPS